MAAVTDTNPPNKNISLRSRIAALLPSTHRIRRLQRANAEPARFRLNPAVQGGHEHHIKPIIRWKAQYADNTPITTSRRTYELQTRHVEEKYGKRREVLGQGASGTVSLYRRSTSSSPDDGRRGKQKQQQQQLCAVKAFSRRSGESAKQYAKRVMAEYCVASVLWHPNIVLTLDLLQDSSSSKGARYHYCQVMEFSAGGDLGAFIASSPNGGALQADEADCFFKQMVRGVEYIHEMGVAHRDLKPGNVLLTPRGAVKISDFGSAELLRHAWETESRMSFGLTGTTPYMAPEMFEGSGEEGYDARGADVWSCGVIYLAMRTGKQFWGVAHEEDGLYRQFVRDSFGVGFGPIEELRREICQYTIYATLDPDPKRRWSAAMVLTTDWIRGVKLCQAGEEGL